VEISHAPVLTLEPVPPDEQLGPVEVIRPQLVLQKLLTHEQYRRPGRRDQEAERHARAAAGIPAPRIVPMRELWDPRLAVVAVHVKDEVVVLDAVVSLPREREVPGPLERRLEPAEMHRRAGAARCLGDRLPDRVADPVGVAEVEANAIGRPHDPEPPVLAPVFRDLCRDGLHEAKRGREILGEEPAAEAIDDRDLVEA
jgi:hypothetical protein